MKAPERTDVEGLVLDAQSRIGQWRPDRVEVPHAALPSISAHVVAGLIDHTLLKADATSDQIRGICDEAVEYEFASVCIQPSWVPLCSDALAGTGVKVCTVVGFPLGVTLSSVKRYEALRTIEDGADEVDMVIHVGRLRQCDYEYVFEDIRGVVEVAQENAALVKTIFETFLLTDMQKAIACALAQAAGADFVKTSTGFSGGGATTDDVALMRYFVGSDMGIKAAGGIRTYDDVRAMVAAGATRIGASAGVQIMKDLARTDRQDVSSEPTRRDPRGEPY